MIASRVGLDVIRVTASKDEARALGKSWRVEADGSVSVLVSTTLAASLEKSIVAALMTAPPRMPEPPPPGEAA